MVSKTFGRSCSMWLIVILFAFAGVVALIFWGIISAKELTPEDFPLYKPPQRHTTSGYEDDCPGCNPELF